jgi:hypothetical protein
LKTPAIGRTPSFSRLSLNSMYGNENPLSMTRGEVEKGKVGSRDLARSFNRARTTVR